jgi:hypothetical protein
MNFKYPQQDKRLWKIQCWLNSDISGDVIVKLKKDDSNSYETEIKTISLIDSTRDIIKKNITFNKQGENFKFKLESTSHFSLLGWINYLFIKGRTIR